MKLTIKSIIVLTLSLVSLLALSGCGNKGPLYLPDDYYDGDPDVSTNGENMEAGEDSKSKNGSKEKSGGGKSKRKSNFLLY